MIAGLLSMTRCATSDSADRSLVVYNGTLIDGTGAQPLRDAVVVIDGERITAVGARTALPAPEGSALVDAQGGSIVPGFINSHVHSGYEEAVLQAWAQAGVTTVRDLAAYPPRSSYALRDAFNANPRNARLVAAGPQMTAVNGFVPSGYSASVFIATPEDGIREANRILDEGADLLKVMMESNWGFPPMSVEAARAIVDTAHARGRRVSVHVSLCRDAERALQIGADDLAHMVIDKLSPDLAKKVADAGVIWVPTIEIWKGVGFGTHVVRNLETFVAVGGAVALGTDFAGSAQVDFDLGMPMKELGWMQDAGMTPMQIIVAATRNGAQACGLERLIGTLQPGKIADLFVVQGDPLTDLQALARVRWVIRSGVVIRQP